MNNLDILSNQQNLYADRNKTISNNFYFHVTAVELYYGILRIVVGFYIKFSLYNRAQTRCTRTWGTGKYCWTFVLDVCRRMFRHGDSSLCGGTEPPSPGDGGKAQWMSSRSRNQYAPPPSLIGRNKEVATLFESRWGKDRKLLIHSNCTLIFVLQIDCLATKQNSKSVFCFKIKYL